MEEKLESQIDYHEEKKLKERDEIRAGRVTVIDHWARIIEKWDKEHYLSHGHWHMD